MLLSADQRGRVALHTFSTLLLRTSASSRSLVEGNYGPVLAIQHLTPFVSNQPMAGSTMAGDEDAGGRRPLSPLSRLGPDGLGRGALGGPEGRQPPGGLATA
jgi:hypothetical protein